MSVYMGVQYRVEVVFMNACVRVWLAFFAVWDSKNLFVFGAQCMYCRTCEHLPVYAVLGRAQSHECEYG